MEQIQTVLDSGALPSLVELASSQCVDPAGKSAPSGGPYADRSGYKGTGGQMTLYDTHAVYVDDARWMDAFVTREREREREGGSVSFQGLCEACIGSQSAATFYHTVFELHLPLSETSHGSCLARVVLATTEPLES